MPTPTKKPRQERPKYPDHDWERVGETLRQFRNDRGVTQAQLAAAIGFRHHSNIAQIEQGLKPLTDGKLLAAAKFLGVQPIAIRRPETMDGAA